jgi:RimJ/RimL family protein N-acetyltransferase
LARPLLVEVWSSGGFSSKRRGRGVASEAVRLVCDLAFTWFGFRRVEVVTDADNVFSRRVAIRNGFEERGIRDGRVLHVREAGE